MDDTCKICQCVLEVKLRCKICKVAMYCGKACQAEDWRTHKHVCKMPVLLYHMHESFLVTYYTTVSRELWKDGEVAPVSLLVGLPIRLIAQPAYTQSEPFKVVARLANSVVMKDPFSADLMINPGDKKSPRTWCKTERVAIVREDNKDLAPAVVELLASYCYKLRTVNRNVTPGPAHFQAFCIQHKADVLAAHASDKKGLRYKAFKHLKLPL